jgi:hypothetical protein
VQQKRNSLFVIVATLFVIRADDCRGSKQALREKRKRQEQQENKLCFLEVIPLCTLATVVVADSEEVVDVPVVGAVVAVLVSTRSSMKRWA